MRHPLFALGLLAMACGDSEDPPPEEVVRTTYVQCDGDGARTFTSGDDGTWSSGAGDEVALSFTFSGDARSATDRLHDGAVLGPEGYCRQP